MSVIVLSSDSFCGSDGIARRVARDLGYECLGPEIEAKAAANFGVPPETLRQAFSCSASPVTLRQSAREKYLAYFQATLISALARGRVLYSGEVGHMFVADVSHILKVKLTADLKDRTARRAKAEKAPASRARELILKEEALRKKWFLKAFEVDGHDPCLFDLVVNLSRLGVERACRMIKDTAEEVRFQPVTYSISSLLDHELACLVRARLIDDFGQLVVTARDGEVTIRSKALSKNKKADSVRRMLLAIEGVIYVVFE